MIKTVKMTDIGNGRPSNQDAYLMKEKKIKGRTFMMAAICDGMGGLKRGEVASQYIVAVLNQWFDNELPKVAKGITLNHMQDKLMTLIKKMNKNMLLMSEGGDDSMGSTLTLLFLIEKEFIVLNVGDSRAYWFDKQHKFVTTDQTLVQMEVKAGRLTREQARRDPRRHILVQCVGVTNDIKVDCYRGKIDDDMEFMLCTDGFYGMLHEEEIYHVPPTKTQMKQYVERCFEKVKERGELDNLSCMLVHVSRP